MTISRTIRKKKLLGKPVIEFQGRRIETSIGELLGVLGSDKLSANELKVKDLSETIDSDMLAELIRCDQLKIGEQIGDDLDGKEIREIEKYYVNRTIYQGVIIKEDILWDPERTDLLAISGIGRKAPDTFGQVGKIPGMDQNITNYTVLNSTREEEHFEDLCAHGPIVWYLTFQASINI